MKGLYNFFSGKGQSLGFGIGLLTVGIVLISAITGMKSAGYETNTQFIDILKQEGSTETFDFFNMAITLPIILIGFILFILAVFSVVQLITNPKGSMKVLLGLLAVAAVFFIFYSMSAPETTGRLAMLHDKFSVGDTTSRIISGGINTTLILLAAGAAAAVIFEIINLFK